MYRRREIVQPEPFMAGFFQVPAGEIRESVRRGGIPQIGGIISCRWSGTSDQQNRLIRQRYSDILFVDAVWIFLR